MSLRLPCVDMLYIHNTEQKCSFESHLIIVGDHLMHLKKGLNLDIGAFHFESRHFDFFLSVRFMPSIYVLPQGEEFAGTAIRLRPLLFTSDKFAVKSSKLHLQHHVLFYYKSQTITAKQCCSPPCISSSKPVVQLIAINYQSIWKRKFHHPQ